MTAVYRDRWSENRPVKEKELKNYEGRVCVCLCAIVDSKKSFGQFVICDISAPLKSRDKSFMIRWCCLSCDSISAM